MCNRIHDTSLKGQADELCSQGNGVEFIQPWYTPISTTPSNTGMAVGGIGNTFTLTPLGDTPNFSFIPGIFIDNSEDGVHLNDFYASVAEPIAVEHLAIANLNELAHHLCFFPATFSGETLEVEGRSEVEVLAAIKEALQYGGFYRENSKNFEAWQVEFSAKTQALIKADADSLQTQLHVALDFFDGRLINRTSKAYSLTAVERDDAIEPIGADKIHYRALYPMAEYEYDAFEAISIHRKVVSPIVREDKELCSLPMHWNEFKVTNNGSQPRVVTLVQSLVNLLGSTYRKARPGVQDSCCYLSQNPIEQRHQSLEFESGNGHHFYGIEFNSESPYGGDVDGQVVLGVELDIATQTDINVSLKPEFYSCHHEQVMLDALCSGRAASSYNPGMHSGREALSGMVCVELVLAPGESRSLRFVQVMDHARIRLKGWDSYKAYTQFYPRKQQRAETILRKQLPNMESVEQRIIKDQCDYFARAQQQIDALPLAEKFSTMAMNSLSFLAESSVWDKNDQLLVKECVDYPFFNSLDVYFYGSFSLLHLLPELDGCVMREFSRAILAEDATPRRFWEFADKPHAPLWEDKYQGVRAVRGAVVHDLGSPFDVKPDAYNWHNVKEWKDLAPKYLLMLYRNYQHNQDRQLVEACWPAAVASIDYLSALIGEGEALPYTRGTDDTFDNLASHGISIYCGSLWSAGMKAASELAELMEQPELATAYRQRSEAALSALKRGLWDEQQGYFHFYITPVRPCHLTGTSSQALQSLGLSLTGDKVQDAALLNRYLDEVAPTSPKLEQRRAKKRGLLETAPQVFTEAYAAIMELDSDNSFGDALLADSYLKLVGLEGLFEDTEIERTLDYLYLHNFELNSPGLGVANMVQADGRPCEAFQAQDVWIGVQFSVATALRLAGKQQQAQTLIERVYDALYHEAKIPFAAPEGFNCSVTVDANGLMQAFELDQKQADLWLDFLKGRAILLDDGRVNPELTRSLSQFKSELASGALLEHAQELHTWLLNTGLKYTAGRYFRPGMIFAYLH